MESAGLTAIADKKRILWIDALKGIGMMLIYLGHFPTNAGLLYPFVFIFHVPLFFFASGLLEKSRTEQRIIPYIKKQFLVLMVPYYVFATLTLLVENVNLINNDITIFRVIIIDILMGARNSTIAQFWFLPCLFLIKVMYRLLNYKRQNKVLTLLVALALWGLVSFDIVPYNTTQWVWGTDDACYYFFFFVVGNQVFPFIKKFEHMVRIRSKIIYCVLVLCSGLLSGVLLFRPQYFYLRIPEYLSFLWKILPTVFALVLIFLFCNIAKILVNIPLLQKAGANTLTLCCFEMLTKTFLKRVLSIMGLSFNLNMPLDAVIVTIICIILTTYGVAPFLSKYLPFVIGKSRKQWRCELPSNDNSALS